MRSFLIFAQVVLVISAISDEEQWQQFKTKYKKNYKSILHDTTRFKIFQDNLRKIEEHNEKFKGGEVSYKLGITKFADMSQKAFRNKLNGLEDSTDDDIFVSFPPSANEEIPDAIDWREKGAVTRVKDQRDCIASWAFAVTASLESHYFLKKDEPIHLSEQYLIDCNNQNNYGCGGGRIINAYLYVNDFGTVTEESYPYQAEDGPCNANGTLLQDLGFAAVSHEEDELKKTIGLVGPAVVSIDARDLNLYAEGVYDNPDCNNETTNHQVLVVGYGTTGDGQDYWLIKNSWGTDWGEEGYLKLLRNKNNHCGITNSAIYPILFPHDPFFDAEDVSDSDDISNPEDISATEDVSVSEDISVLEDGSIPEDISDPEIQID